MRSFHFRTFGLGCWVACLVLLSAPHASAEDGTQGRGHNRWILWLPFAGDHGAVTEGATAILIEKDRVIERPHTNRVLDLAGAIGRVAGVDFVVESELAVYQFSTGPGLGTTETISIRTGLHELLGVLQSLYSSSPFHQEPSDRSRRVVLRYGVTSARTPPDKRFRPAISLTVSEFQVSKWVKALATSFGISDDGSGAGNLVKRVLEVESYRPSQCEVDEVLNAVWLKLPAEEAERFVEEGLRGL